MYLRGRIVTGGLALAALLILGIAGYVAIEGWPFLDALYMTFLTFTTVGYQEVRPLSTSGRVFTIFLMVGGVGMMLYLLSAVVSQVVEQGMLRSYVRRRRMKTRLAGLNHHFILCGFGRVGREIAQAFSQESVRFIVVDNSTQAIAEADELGFLYVQGDATQDETLLSAGVERARGLIAAVGGDSENVFIALSARGLNQDLTIVARGTSAATEGKLRRAGADHVVSPYTIGGRRMAHTALRPLTLEFVDSMFNSEEGRGLRLVEVTAVEGSPLAGLPIERSCSSQGVQVLALKRSQGEMVINPGSDVVIEPGDALVVAGTNSQLARLTEPG